MPSSSSSSQYASYRKSDNIKTNFRNCGSKGLLKQLLLHRVSVAFNVKLRKIEETSPFQTSFEILI